MAQTKKQIRASSIPSQAPLMEFKMPSPIFEGAQVNLAFIQPPPHSLKPSRDFIESVRRWGVIEPLILVAPKDSDREDGYEIVEGRRRFLAASEVGLVTVPATAYQFADRGDVVAALTIMLNTQRSSNPIAEFLAIQHLVVLKMTPKEISIITDLPIATIKKRMRLADLRDEILEGVINGQVPISVAERIANLPKKVQTRLVGVLRKQQRITGRDLHDVREIQKKAEASKHTEMFENMPVDEPVDSQRPEYYEGTMRPAFDIGIGLLLNECKERLAVHGDGTGLIAKIEKVLELWGTH